MNTQAATCSEIIRQYDAQGWHRTGTLVDNDSADWLIRELHARDVAARLQSFPFSRVDIEPCRVWAGGWEVAGQPMPDGRLPGPGSVVTGAISDSPDPAALALIRLDGHGRSDLLDRLRREPWALILVAVDGTPKGLTVRNAWHYEDPVGVPVVQVPASSWQQLSQLKALGMPLSVTCGAIRSEVTAANVAARIPGSQPSLSPIVVLTPRSGWWHCAGERGGGLAIWLEAARQVRRSDMRREVVFLATTGHELGFLGISRYLDTDAALATRALLWIHLGANIGALESPTVVRAAEEPLLEEIRGIDASLLSSALQPECQLVKQPPGGEAQVVAAAGGRYVSIVGKGFPLFHSTEDRWPEAINAQAMAHNANLVVALIERMDVEPA